MEILFPLLLIVAFYFLLIRPQQQRVKAQRHLQESLTVGDEVVTIGGLLGRISALDDESVRLDTGDGTLLRFRRQAIAGRVNPSPLAEDPSLPDDGDAGTGTDRG